MKNASACAKNLAAFLKRIIDKSDESDLPNSDDPVEVLILSFLMWESTTGEAYCSYRKLKDAFVDCNEFRVSLPYEIVEKLSLTDSKALERCQRMRATLTDIFKREHSVTLDRLKEEGKRDVRKYLDTLEGMVPYVAARVSLLVFQSHAIPVDDHLRSLLIEEGAADDSSEIPELAPWLSRQVKASDGRTVHFALQAWSDNAFETIRSGNTTGRSKSTGKKNTKKTKSVAGKKTSSINSSTNKG